MRIIKNSATVLEELMRKRASWQRVLADVLPICRAVEAEGDEAVMRYSRLLDGVDAPKRIEIQPQGDEALRCALERAAQNIRAFAERQLLRGWTEERPEGVVGELVRPLERVGCYVPGGRYPLVSSVLMTVIPARVAGVSEIVVCTPRPSQEIQLACAIAGADALFAVGGAQAIAAMAYGTATLPRVDKIVGPGNAYVTAAKQLVSGVVGIDFLAGPSEVVIVADASCNAAFVAADLLAQSEHDPESLALVITTRREVAERICKEVQRQLHGLPTASVARSALEDSACILVEDLQEAIACANRLAPEHLELHVEDPAVLLSHIRSAGAIFCGSYTPEAIGDYLLGPNHVLPTGGLCRFRSALSARDFQRMSTLSWVSKEGCQSLCEAVTTLARTEGLEAHARSVERRRV